MKKEKKHNPEPMDDCMAGSPTDVLGSYTGVPADPYDIPVQDADDL
jgi:hypothetical protein